MNLSNLVTDGILLGLTTVIFVVGITIPIRWFGRMLGFF